MSLFRQLLLAVSAAFLLLLAGVQVIYVMNARDYLQQQLDSHAQDAATALGMSLATLGAADDPVLTETVLQPVFDRGFYQAIHVFDVRGVPVVEKTLQPAPAEVPAWFSRLVVLKAPTHESKITAGWKQLGRVVVTSHPNFAYAQLWHTSRETLGMLFVGYIVVLLATHLFLKTILRPLRAIRRTARAIGERDFRTMDIQPSAPELREVVDTINAMSAKIRDAIASEVTRAEAFRAEAFTDPLSQLDNRRGFERKLSDLLLPDSEAFSGVLFMVEIDGFKAYNQQYGFQRGDELIHELGLAFEDKWDGTPAILARLGGATFALLFENVTWDEADALARDLHALMARTLSRHDDAPATQFFCGGCYFDGNRPTQSALLSGADMALLQAAQSHNSQGYEIVRIDTGDHNSKGSQYWKAEIERALWENRIALFSQPVLALDHHKPLHQEIVVRFIERSGETVDAEQFLPMAVRHNLIGRIDHKVVSMLLSHLNSSSTPGPHYALNLSAWSIEDDAFVTWLLQVLWNDKALASRLTFEMTESGIVHHLETVCAFVGRLRATGARFAVDNFGLHHQAFHYLQMLMPDYIKPSRSFFGNLERLDEDQFFLESVVNICKPLEITVIAQAVEDESMLPTLRRLGFDGYQGYATASPTRTF